MDSASPNRPEILGLNPSAFADGLRMPVEHGKDDPEI